MKSSMKSINMELKFKYLLIILLAVDLIGARDICPSHPNCVCGNMVDVELNCNIDGQNVTINLLPNTYINIKCENATKLDYSQLPKCADQINTFKSVSFKDCPLPTSSFKDVLLQLGVSKTMSLIFQNAKKLSGHFKRHHFAGLENLTKLLLSVNGLTHLPDNVFMDINNLTWLNIRCNNINLSEELFKPLEKLETLEISHNQMTNMSSNLFAHLALLRKLSLWQSNVTWFSKDFFSGVDVLEELDLSSNGLNELPTLIFKPLTKLKKLTLFSNKFSSLPQNLFSTNHMLETVIILNNDVKMKELPKRLFGNLWRLKQIYIQRSGIEVVPYDLFANSPQITDISLAYNDIAVLPESTFNDQINLLELDLSHNRIKKLESKMFSSLVKLERLDLCYNAVEEIDRTTFASLLSLIYLNMEHNNLKTIASPIFQDNKLSMSINLAYNQLDFETKEFQDGSWKEKVLSPFLNTKHLRLLNLSHNNFKISYNDWWINGHDTLDISYNKLDYLWEYLHIDSRFEANLLQLGRIWKRNIKELSVLGNPLVCRCENIRFLDFLNDRTKVTDDTLVHCSILIRRMCSPRFVIFISVLLTAIFFVIISITIYWMYGKQIHLVIKKLLHYFSLRRLCRRNGARDNVLVVFSSKDEVFVYRKIMLIFDEYPNLNVEVWRMNEPKIKNVATSQKKAPTSGYDLVLVVFTQNYLAQTYKHINIKEIRGEMLKLKNTIFIFADMGSENSIYTFLKDQRDVSTTMLWDEINFRPLLRRVLFDIKNRRWILSKFLETEKLTAEERKNVTKLSPNNSFSSLSDSSEK